ncbi:MAG: hypothetical protein QMC24_06925 [Akkermansiaceae bacterium]|jgi:hypothetical protein|tara:strand:- start:1078 stop:1830 length:753 start_codon:yes stop_codon:yes gene_type:complete
MRGIFILLLALPSFLGAQLRIDPKRFAIPESEIREVLELTIAAFSKSDLPPLFVTNSPEGPITLFDRSARGEVIIKLDVRERYWAQMIYQFAHELAHVRANFRPDARDNKWFEETLCETASLYALRKLSLTLRDHPNFDSYRHHLHDYAEKIIANREKVDLKTLAAFYQKHETTLRKDATDRPLNGAMAVALLPLFETNPGHWNSLGALNKSPAKKDLPLSGYFKKWHDDTSAPHRPFIQKVKSHFLPEK